MTSAHAPGEAPEAPPDRARDEAGTDEVAALAAFLERPSHVVPQQRQDDDGDGADDTAADVAEVGADVEVEHVLPRQRDEFTCSSCFLVAHVSRRAAGTDRCLDCA